jgi:hypothetical protein
MSTTRPRLLSVSSSRTTPLCQPLDDARREPEEPHRVHLRAGGLPLRAARVAVGAEDVVPEQLHEQLPLFCASSATPCPASTRAQAASPPRLAPVGADERDRFRSRSVHCGYRSLSPFCGHRVRVLARHDQYVEATNLVRGLARRPCLAASPRGPPRRGRRAYRPHHGASG